MNINETISLLDELRGKATQGEWEYSEYGAETNDDVLIMQKTRTGKRKEDWIVIPSVNDGDASCITENKNIGYIVALHNALPALRQAALDGERYREEAEQYQRFKMLLGIKSHDSIMRLTSENKDFPVTATMIMIEEDNERRRNAMRYIETSARAGKDLAKAIEKSQEGNDWCADCLAKVDCREALEAYRQAVEQKEV